MPLSAKLVVVGGEVKSAEIKLRLPSTIGRGRGATIMLPHPLVSRQHCELFETNGRLMVRDLGSLNGTFVNNERISEAPLAPGELLTVGAVTFRAVYEVQDESSPPDAPTAPQLKSSRSRDTDPNGTLRAAGGPRDAVKSTRETHRPVQASEPTVPLDDFNFELPVTPVDEAPRATDPAPVPAVASSAVEPTIGTRPANPAASGTPARPTPGKPESGPAAVKPAPAAPAPAAPVPLPLSEPESATFDPPSKHEKADSWKWDQEDDQSQPAGQEDDDFGDFLKSLGSK